MYLLTQISKFLFIFFMILFAVKDYTWLLRRSEEKKNRVLGSQIRILYLYTGLGALLILLNEFSVVNALLVAGILIYYGITLVAYRLIYPRASMLLVNNMLMLLGTGFLVITRLNNSQGIKQFLIAAAGTVIAFIVPVIVRNGRFLPRLTWLYAVIGIAALLVVLALARISGGARLSLSVGGVTIQFSEVVKITLVFFLAAKLSADRSFRSVVIATIVAAMHVVILVLSTDLGTALVFFVAYIVIVYVATRKPVYPLAGLAAGAAASVGAYHLFGHVRQRVTAYVDPFSVYDTSGYQIVQGLFAIGAGGWFGTGFYLGRPQTIPVATKDFIFSAICEEFGTVFAIGMLLVCMSMYLLIVSISMQLENTFFRLVAIGLGTEYAFQVFLTVGGVTKFIPMTGITLPLVSYGGSSVISTIIMLAIIQGLYILRDDEAVAEEYDEEPEEELYESPYENADTPHDRTEKENVNTDAAYGRTGRKHNNADAAYGRTGRKRKNADAYGRTGRKHSNAGSSYGAAGREQFYDKGIDPERYAEFLRDLEEADTRDGRK